MSTDSFGESGLALWDSVQASRSVGPEFVALLVNACRVADRLDLLSEQIASEPLVVVNAKGDQVANPLLTEHRMQFQVLGQALARLGIDKLPKASVKSKSFADRLADAAAQMDASPKLAVVK